MEQELISSVRYLGAIPMFLVALMLALKNRGRQCSAVYNRSRWLLITATLLMGTHSMIQYLGHFREQSLTLCWAINMLFYVTVTPLYNLAEMNLLRAGHNMKPRYWRAAVMLAISYIALAAGYFTDTLINDEKPYMTVTFYVACFYFINLLELSWVLGRDLKMADARLTDEELDERHNALRFTARVMGLIILFSLATPLVTMSASLLLNAIFGMVMFVLIIWFMIMFLSYGDNMSEVIEVNDEIAEAAMMEEETAMAETSDQEDTTVMRDLQQRIELWVSQRHFTNPNITIGEALDEMGISAKMLNLYLLQFSNVDGYRAWLPTLRIKEAKRIMMEHPEYSLQAVADACGYTRSSNLSRAFKAHEGISPSEWLSRNKDNGEKKNQ